MDATDIKKHWEHLAKTYGKEVFATTKNLNIKLLEINALKDHISKISSSTDKKLNILEVGCGNGLNCLELAKSFPQHIFHGVDYVEDMINNAKANNKTSTNNFWTGDVLLLDKLPFLLREYDIIFTVRCLINLNSFELQCDAMAKISRKIASGGMFFMIENSIDSHSKQNILRANINLPKREPASYNLFFNDRLLLDFLAKNTTLNFIEIDNFTSLHDVMLYAVLPQLNNGKIIYDSPVMDALTTFLINNTTEIQNEFGDFGQNKMFVFKNEKISSMM